MNRTPSSSSTSSSLSPTAATAAATSKIVAPDLPGFMKTTKITRRPETEDHRNATFVSNAKTVSYRGKMMDNVLVNENAVTIDDSEDDHHQEDDDNDETMTDEPVPIFFIPGINGTPRCLKGLKTTMQYRRPPNHANATKTVSSSSTSSASTSMRMTKVPEEPNDEHHHKHHHHHYHHHGHYRQERRRSLSPPRRRSMLRKSVSLSPKRTGLGQQNYKKLSESVDCLREMLRTHP